MKPDVIVCWPRHLDYPLWRQFIRNNRTRFAKIIIVFTDMKANTADYRKFVEEAMLPDSVICLDNDEVQGDQDWRSVATNKALRWSDAQWIWFTEQDFIIHKPERFWPGLDDCLDTGADVIGYNQDNKRLHPCCIFIRRFILDNFTSKDFGVVKDKSDHFSVIEQELQKASLESGFSIFRIVEEARYDWFEHLNGLSQNMFLLQTGGEPNYQPDRFKWWLKKCLEVQVPLDTDFVLMAEKYV